MLSNVVYVIITYVSYQENVCVKVFLESVRLLIDTFREECAGLCVETLTLFFSATLIRGEVGGG